MSPARWRGRCGSRDRPRSAKFVRRTFAVIASGLTALVLVAGPAAAAAVADTATPTVGPAQTTTGTTNPLGVLQLPGADGGSHVWVSDLQNGVCRMDPGPDGRLRQNRATCVLSIGQVFVESGQLSYDHATNKVYVPDMSEDSVGVVRLGYDPAADGGRGAMSLTTDRVAIAFGCGLETRLPWASAFGPDGNLYLGFARSGDIVRITTPAGDKQTCEVAGSAVDGKAAYRLAFIGENLWEVDSSGLGMIPNARAAKGVKATPIMDAGAAAATRPSSSTASAPTGTATSGATTTGGSPAATGGDGTGTGSLDPSLQRPTTCPSTAGAGAGAKTQGATEFTGTGTTVVRNVIFDASHADDLVRVNNGKVIFENVTFRGRGTGDAGHSLRPPELN